MRVNGSRVLVLGGAGLVGTAVCRELLARQPAEITVHSRRPEKALAARQVLLEEAGETELSVASGDIFGLTAFKIKDIREKLGCDLIEMEGSAAAQVCWQMGVPHLVIRSGSNLAQPNPGADYRKLGQIAAHQAARFTAHVVERLGTKAP